MDTWLIGIAIIVIVSLVLPIWLTLLEKYMTWLDDNIFSRKKERPRIGGDIDSAIKEGLWDQNIGLGSDALTRTTSDQRRLDMGESIRKDKS